MKSTDTDIRSLKDEEIAPCIVNGPIAANSRRLIELSEKLGNSIVASTLRVWTTACVFGAKEKVFAENVEPTEAINQHLSSIIKFIAEGPHIESCFALSLSNSPSPSHQSSEQSTEEKTGNHYAQLFGNFSPESFWDEPTRLLSQRLERNEISESLWKDKSVLDAGCGGGRYTVAWKKLGSGSVTGLDLSARNVQDASRRVEVAGLANVRFLQGSTLELPFDDSAFDVVFSNGVLHHTNNWKKGIQEIVRTLKPGGLGWLYLIENPGGLHWDLIEVLRVIMKNEDSNQARQILTQMGVPANRVFYMLDHVMAPVNSLLTGEEIKTELERAGARQVKRLTRGVDFDRIERIYRKEPFAEAKYGVGENRFTFTK